MGRMLGGGCAMLAVKNEPRPQIPRRIEVHGGHRSSARQHGRRDPVSIRRDPHDRGARRASPSSGLFKPMGSGIARPRRASCDVDEVTTWPAGGLPAEDDGVDQRAARSGRVEVSRAG
jgi:hypothetical protein